MFTAHTGSPATSFYFLLLRMVSVAPSAREGELPLVGETWTCRCPRLPWGSLPARVLMRWGAVVGVAAPTGPPVGVTSDPETGATTGVSAPLQSTWTAHRVAAASASSCSDIS